MRWITRRTVRTGLSRNHAVRFLVLAGSSWRSASSFARCGSPFRCAPRSLLVLPMNLRRHHFPPDCMLPAETGSQTVRPLTGSAGGDAPPATRDAQTGQGRGEEGERGSGIRHRGDRRLRAYDPVTEAKWIWGAVLPRSAWRGRVVLSGGWGCHATIQRRLPGLHLLGTSRWAAAQRRCES